MNDIHNPRFKSWANDIRIQDCLKNHDQYVMALASLPDKELVKKLELVHIQSALAEQTKNTASLELLEIWRSQIIEARIYKAENNITDSPNEIELAIAGIETVVATSVERMEAIDEFNNPEIQSVHKEESKNDDSTQLSLF